MFDLSFCRQEVERKLARRTRSLRKQAKEEAGSPSGSLVSQYLKQKKELRRLRQSVGEISSKKEITRPGKTKRAKSRKGSAQGIHQTDTPHEHLEVYRQWKAKQESGRY